MWKELIERGVRVGKERVRRLMKLHGIKARGKRKFVVTTDSKHDLTSPVARAVRLPCALMVEPAMFTVLAEVGV